jgi:hypothetical protein
MTWTECQWEQTHGRSSEESKQLVKSNRGLAFAKRLRRLGRSLYRLAAGGEYEDEDDTASVGNRQQQLNTACNSGHPKL